VCLRSVGAGGMDHDGGNEDPQLVADVALICADE
jgi:hypothetical protein